MVKNEENHQEPDNKIYNETILSGKIHESLEDPVSQIMYDVSEAISPTLYSVGVTPNIVTTVRLVMTIAAYVYFFENKYYRTSAILLFLAYFGDCLDGHMARKYNMDTTFGDYYDHLADMLFAILFFYYASVKIHPEYDWLMLLILVFTIISMIQIGCEERYLRIMGTGKDSEVMGGLEGLCPKSVIPNDELEDLMEYSRIFGVGTLILFVSIIVWNFEHFENDS
jgi:CDP-alcohol phosphatidyltransferase-like enzyme